MYNNLPWFVKLLVVNNIRVDFFLIIILTIKTQKDVKKISFQTLIHKTEKHCLV